MSYCRFDPCSDVYCYLDVDGIYQLHVAINKWESDTPCPAIDPEDIFQSIAAREAWKETAKLVPIGLPRAGTSYTFKTPGECVDFMRYLAGMGFQVPEWAIDSLREETA